MLHDFFLYHTLRGAGPDLVGFLALAAFTKPAGCTCQEGGDTGLEGECSGSDTAETTDSGLEGGGSGSDTADTGQDYAGSSASSCQDSRSNESRYFSREEVLKWLEVFYRRFLTQQYKRSTLVDGPVIWEGMTLSPRAGFNFPADLSPDAALTQLKNL